MCEVLPFVLDMAIVLLKTVVRLNYDVRNWNFNCRKLTKVSQILYAVFKCVHILYDSNLIRVIYALIAAVKCKII